MLNRLKKLCRRIIAAVVRSAADDDISVVIIVWPGGSYAWIFDHAHRGEALCSMGRAASDPDLDFDWAAATVASEKVSMLCEQGGRIKCQR